MKTAINSVIRFLEGKGRRDPMQNSTLFVQEPDYTAFRKTALPVQVLGAVYDGRDPYATPLGVVLLVLENNFAREMFVPRESRAENGKVLYRHDLTAARYVSKRNGFEIAQLGLGENDISEEAKNTLRAFFDMQNNREMNGKYVIETAG